jgi:hypothetical protein
MGSEVTLEMTFRAPPGRVLRRPVMGIVINHATLGTVGGVNTRMTGFESDEPCAAGVMSCTLKRMPLLQGSYSVELWLGDGHEDLDCLMGYLSFQIEPTDIYGSGQTPFARLGAIYLEPKWELAPDMDVAAEVTGTTEVSAAPDSPSADPLAALSSEH